MSPWCKVYGVRTLSKMGKNLRSELRLRHERWWRYYEPLPDRFFDDPEERRSDQDHGRLLRLAQLAVADHRTQKEVWEFKRLQRWREQKFGITHVNGKKGRRSTVDYSVELSGRRFGSLVVLDKLLGHRALSGQKWLCQCDCGRQTSGATTADLIKENGTRSCGHCNDRNWAGHRSGRLLVLGKAPSDRDKSGKVRMLLACRCDCGRELSVPVTAFLRTQPWQSCGCLKLELAKTTALKRKERQRHAAARQLDLEHQRRLRQLLSLLEARKCKLERSPLVKHPVGSTFERLTVIGSGQTASYLFRCICGNELEGRWGQRKSCGCQQREVLRVLLATTPRRTGPAHHNWKGGIANHRRGKHGGGHGALKKWKRLVLTRDKFTCLNCHFQGTSPELVSHHIESYDDNPKLRLVVANGATLCTNCHKCFHLAYGFGHNDRYQFELWLAGGGSAPPETNGPLSL